jgi:aspartate ammonia-lyase
MGAVRIERDSMGELAVPAHAYYGVQTARAVANFPVSGLRADAALIRAYGRLKLAAARVNLALGALTKEQSAAIQTAAEEVAAGKWNGEFVVDAFQAGAGTSFHMNVNEVICNRALERLGKHRGEYAFLSPNDHVNYGQSTNDTYPTALHLAALERWAQLLPVLEALAAAFDERGRAFHGVLKAGRTHLQDAVPVRLGQEFRAYAEAVRRSMRLGQAAAGELGDLAIGGSAAGTGLNVRPGYPQMMVEELQKLTGLPLRNAPDLREAMQSRQAVGAMSAALRALALELVRIANDLRLLASGPATGFAEITLPAVQPGSSIMPGKVNPVLAECLNMVGFQVAGNDAAVALAVQAGQLELNVMMPLMAHNLLQSFALLTNFVPVFTQQCVAGITADAARALDYAHRTAALGTVLNPVVGYLKAAELVKESLATGRSVRELVIDKGILTPAQIDALLDPTLLTGEA